MSLIVAQVGDSHAEGLAPRSAEIVRSWGHTFRSHFLRGLKTSDAGEWMRGVVAGRPDLIWIVLGTNDLEDAPAFARAVSLLMDELGAADPNYTAPRVAWWAPPPATRSPFAETNARNKEILRTADARYLWLPAEPYADPKFLRDGVHYSAGGYRQWAEHSATEALLHLGDLRGVPARLLVAIADAETGGGFQANLTNPSSGATGLFQITRILLVDHERREGRRYAISDMKDPAKGADVAAAYLRIIIDRLASLGLPLNLGSKRYIGLVGLAYNAGLAEVGRILQAMKASGRDLRTVEPAEVVALTARPQRTYYAAVQHAFFRGNEPEAEPPTPEPAPGRQRRSGGLIAALLGGLGFAAIAAWRGKRRKKR